MSSSSGVREPTVDEFNSFINLVDILNWPKLKGSMEHQPSQQGSLLNALGADADITIDEFASIPPDEFEHILQDTWYYSESVAADDGLSVDPTIRPPAIVKARARAAHHAARLWIGAEDTRATKCRRLNDEADTAAVRRCSYDGIPCEISVNGVCYLNRTFVELIECIHLPVRIFGDLL